MASQEFTKLSAAVLLAGIAFVGSGLIANIMVRPVRLEHPAITIDVAVPGKGPDSSPGPEPSIAALLANADAARGEAQVKAQGCVACHTFTEGGKDGVGPNLYNVVGSPHGHEGGFAYSAVLKAKQGPWTFEELNEWLRKPSAYAPGTKMSFAGVADPKKRSDIIEYLRTLSAQPQPRPEAPAPAEAAAGTPAPAPAGGPAAPIGVRLASASADLGKAETLKQACIACHTFNEGGRAGVGPNLYGVVGGPHAHMPGFAYSPALKAKEGPWTYEELDQWLTKPAAYAPGTKMAFAGVADPKVRADLIAYLRSLSATPEPLPAAH